MTRPYDPSPTDTKPHNPTTVTTHYIPPCYPDITVRRRHRPPTVTLPSTRPTRYNTTHPPDTRHPIPAHDPHLLSRAFVPVLLVVGPGADAAVIPAPHTLTSVDRRRPPARHHHPRPPPSHTDHRPYTPPIMQPHIPTPFPIPDNTHSLASAALAAVFAATASSSICCYLPYADTPACPAAVAEPPLLC